MVYEIERLIAMPTGRAEPDARAVISAALQAAKPRPLPTDSQTAKNQYAARFAEGFSSFSSPRHAR